MTTLLVRMKRRWGKNHLKLTAGQPEIYSLREIMGCVMLRFKPPSTPFAGFRLAGDRPLGCGRTSPGRASTHFSRRFSRR